MGKRSDFPRMKADFYVTPPEAVLPLLPHLKYDTKFAEPCAGNGALSAALEGHGYKCLYEADADPKADHIHRADALKLCGHDLRGTDMIITNPPWTREILHPMILRFALLRPTWLLFDGDWAHTKQAVFYLRICRRIVSAGRVRWITGSKNTGKDNAAWYLFDGTAAAGSATVFEGLS